MNQRLTPLLFALTFAFLCTGCARGLPRQPISGTVNLNGQPLAAGVIRLVPQPGVAAPAVQAAIQNGKFEFTKSDGPFVGAHRVEIEGPWTFAMDDEAAYAQFTLTHRGQPPRNPIPPQYNRQSTLTADIPAGGTEALTFDLRAGPGGR